MRNNTLRNRWIAACLTAVMAVSSIQPAFVLAEDIPLETELHETETVETVPETEELHTEPVEEVQETMAADAPVTETGSSPETDLVLEEPDTESTYVIETEFEPETETVKETETSLDYTDKDGKYHVTVSSETGFENGSSLQVKEETDTSVINGYLSSIEEAYLSNNGMQVSDYRLPLDFTVLDPDGNEAELPGIVRIDIQTSDPSRFADFILYHLSESGNWDSYSFSLEKDGVSFMADESGTWIWAASGIKEDETEETGSASEPLESETEAYTEQESEVLPETELEEVTESELETETESETSSELEMETETESETIQQEQTETEGVAFDASQDVNGVTVHVSAPAGVFPDGCTMQAKEVSDQDVQNKVEETVSGEANIAKSYLFDITVFDSDGNEIQPDTSKGRVTVSFQMKEAEDANLDSSVFHIDDDMNVTELGEAGTSVEMYPGYETPVISEPDKENEAEDLPAMEPETIAEQEETSEADSSSQDDGIISVETYGFSYYAVEFTYNSKSYDIMTGEEVDLDTVKSSVGLSGDISNATSSSEKVQVNKKTNANGKEYWAVSSDVDFTGEAEITMTISEVDYIIQVTAIDSYDKFAFLFEDGTVAFVDKTMDEADLEKEYGKILHRNAVSETSSCYPLSGFPSADIKHIVFKTQVSPVNSTAGWFYGCENLLDVTNAKLLNMENVTEANAMFSGCSSLKYIDTSGWTIDNVKNMTTMFMDCSSLQNIDTSSWILSNVTTMEAMFSGCTSLQNINTSNWILANVTTMEAMFSGCTSLQNVDTSNWDLKNLRSVSNMFYNCSSMTEIAFRNKNFYFSSVGSFIRDCTNLKTVDFTGCNFYSCKTGGFWSNLTCGGHSCPNVEKVILKDTTFYTEYNVSDNFSTMFLYCPAKMIDIRGLKLTSTSAGVSYEAMFNECSNLTSIFGLDELGDYSHITSLCGMFYNCTSLTSVDLSFLDTSYVYSFSSMFYGCTNLLYANLSGWKILKYSSSSYSDLYFLGGLFNSCNKLKSLNINNWDFTGNHVSSLDNFYGYTGLGNCSSLESINASGWALGSSIRSADYFLAGCSMKNLDLSNWSISSSQFQRLYDFLNRCDNLRTVNISGWHYSDYSTFSGAKGINATYMFSACSKLNGIIGIEEFGKNIKLTETNSMFYNTAIKTIDLHNWNMAYVTQAQAMFAYSAVEEINASGWNWNSITNLSNLGGLFASGSLEKLNINNWTMSGISGEMTNFKSLLNSNVEYISMDHFSAPNITQIANLTINLSNLKTISFRYPNLPNLRSAAKMFDACRADRIDLEGFDTSLITDMSSMFRNCNNLKVLDISGFDTENVSIMAEMFRGCSSLTTLNTSSLQTSNVTIMASMFAGCSSLTKLDLSNLDTSKVTNMDSMLSNCISLTELNVEGWDTSNVTSMPYLLANDTALYRLKLGKDFVFCTGDKAGKALPYETWRNMESNQTVSLLNEYDGATMAGTYTPEDYSVKLDTSNISYLEYDEENQKVTAYLQSSYGNHPVTVKTVDMHAPNLKIDAGLVNKCTDLKSALDAGFAETNLKLEMKSITYADFASCVKQAKTIWTFDIPKGNESVVRIDIYNAKTNAFAGYIINSEKTPNVFSLYDSNDDFIETLTAGKRHTYRDLGYQAESVVEQYDSSLKKYVEKSVDYKNYGNDLYIYKDASVSGYNSSKHKLLDDYIYPEYSDYVSYNSGMDNYEVPFAPGKYKIEITASAAPTVSLTPGHIVTKNKTSTVNGESVTEEVPDEYVYISQVAESDIGSGTTSFTLFNEVLKDSVFEVNNVEYQYEILKKIDENGYGMSNVKFKLTSKRNGSVYYEYTDSQGCIQKSYASEGEVFIAEEVEAPSGYRINSNPVEITFVRKSYQQTVSQKEVIFSDAISITKSDARYSYCDTCMSYSSQCTCHLFGSCGCSCCGTSFKTIEIAPEYVYVTNYRKDNPVIKKEVDSSASGYDKAHTTFLFSLYDNDVSTTVPFTTLRLKAGYATSLTGLVSGHTYTVVEQEYEPDTYTPADSQVVSSNDPDAGSHEWMTTVSSDTGTAKVKGASCTFTYDEDSLIVPTITFTNHHNLLKRDLKVSKKLTTDNSSDKEMDTDFEFTLNLTNVTLDVKGCEITYRKSDGTTGTIALDENNEYSFTLKDGQDITFSGIPEVTQYTVSEKAYPTYHVTATDAEGKLIGANAEAVFTNDRIDLYELPLTGGQGNTLPYVLFFAATIAFCAAGISMKKRTKTK